MRKILLSFLALLLATTVLPWPAAEAQNPAQAFVVVVNRANPVTTISRNDLSRMFMKQLLRWPNGLGVQPVDLVGTSPIRESFSRQIHGRSASSVTSFWRQQIFSGRGVPPPEQGSDAEVVRYVASHPGAVGYVAPTTNVTTVKVIQVTGL